MRIVSKSKNETFFSKWLVLFKKNRLPLTWLIPLSMEQTKICFSVHNLSTKSLQAWPTGIRHTYILIFWLWQGGKMILGGHSFPRVLALLTTSLSLPLCFPTPLPLSSQLPPPLSSGSPQVVRVESSKIGQGRLFNLCKNIIPGEQSSFIFASLSNTCGYIQNVQI